MPYYPQTFRKIMVQIKDAHNKLDLYISLIDAVHYAHTTGCWHRDIKPENIMFDESNNELILTDFGIAHIVEDFIKTDIETKAGSRLANFQYASPEQRQVGGSVDHRSDIYSLGLILNELFTGNLPWGHDYQKIQSTNPDFEFLDLLVEKMLKQNPNERIQSLSELKITLLESIRK